MISNENIRLYFFHLSLMNSILLKTSYVCTPRSCFIIWIGKNRITSPDPISKTRVIIIKLFLIKWRGRKVLIYYNTTSLPTTNSPPKILPKYRTHSEIMKCAENLEILLLVVKCWYILEIVRKLTNTASWIGNGKWLGPGRWIRGKCSDSPNWGTACPIPPSCSYALIPATTRDIMLYTSAAWRWQACGSEWWRFSNGCVISVIKVHGKSELSIFYPDYTKY